ncbi:gp31 [Aeromonas phage 31]|uniref:Head assembly cochaperone with GroEL n=4 Tax=Biquartavirus TaxID=1912143 RepID=Q6U9A8_9CAUD|nr:head morphogenesis [Aeromonas phage 44RR2.8t]YP_238921.1 head morphogenesis [Aeromonas phage 31]APU00666.1 head assembly chaperone [Aeromonas phage 44RR2.8t.2]APU01085.1 head assembly chaperone [Aeromonas phage 31.2]APU01995.1 head assembly chaperone [Aeromonas phage L9-6]APU02247.1 head assembly chaperone [Aeromonas phage Riv-10]APU02494.1 head assembly chaperone [Aeromonas phage SW69-9]UYD59747.1 capsid assembly protein [Aeromonas phage avDM5]UYD60523.1 capsid assembly protein [Aeromon
MSKFDNALPIAQFESIIIESKQLASAGDEIMSSTIPGFVVGKRDLPEIPLTAEVISVGPEVPDHIKPGMVILVPNGRLDNVPDPRYLRGEIDVKQSRKMSVTHWKNIQVIYA